jgi:hypothetical protein
MTRQFATNDLLHCCFVFVLGSALKCNVCKYRTTQPKEQQKCTSATLTCPSGFPYCFTSFATFQNGTEIGDRGCTTAAACTNPEKWCKLVAVLWPVKSCALECCNTDNCNNYTPSSATGVMVTKFTLSLMVIVGFIFA